jgi:hypothetical protein
LEKAKEQTAEEPKAEEPAAPEEKAEEPAAIEATAAEPAKVEEKAKPELATFRLKRGKADAPEREHKPRADKKFDKKEKTFSKPDKKKFDGEKKDFKKKKSDRPKRDHDDGRERVYSSNPQKFEDSPFAILQQLKDRK